jgi:hypothetical protein
MRVFRTPASNHPRHHDEDGCQEVLPSGSFSSIPTLIRAGFNTREH